MKEVLKELQKEYRYLLRIREENKEQESTSRYLEGRIFSIKQAFNMVFSKEETSNILVAKLITPNGEEFLVAHNWRVVKSDIEGVEVGSLIGTSRLIDLVEKLDSTLIINNKKSDIETWVG